MKSFRIPSALAVAVIVASGMSTHAETPAVTNQYSTWFAALDRLELPNIATAAYVHVEGLWSCPLGSSHETSGNAWMLSETRDADGRPRSGGGHRKVHNSGHRKVHHLRRVVM